MNTNAGENNPHRISFFIRVVHRTGRMNPGTWYECTDGKGEIWHTAPHSIEVLPELPACPDCAAKDAEIAKLRNGIEAFMDDDLMDTDTALTHFGALLLDRAALKEVK